MVGFSIEAPLRTSVPALIGAKNITDFIYQFDVCIPALNSKFFILFLAVLPNSKSKESKNGVPQTQLVFAFHVKGAQA